MIHVVVPVLTVSAHAIKIFDRIEVFPDLIEILIYPEICRVCLLHAQAFGIQNIAAAFDNADPDKLLHGKRGEIGIRHIPHFVALVAEILGADPHRVFEIVHHIRRPVVEYLEPAHADIALLDIYPAIRNNVAHRLFCRFVFDLQFIDKHADSHVIAVRKVKRDIAHLRGDFGAVHPGDKILYRHGGDIFFAGVYGFRAAADGIHAAYPAAADIKPGHTGIHAYLAAEPCYLCRKRFPKLTGALLRVIKLFDKRGFHLCTLFLEGLAYERPQRFGKRKPLHALRAPIGGNVLRVHAPELCRIILEKHLVKRASEAIDIKVFQRILRQLVKNGCHVSEPDAHRVFEAHVFKCRAGKRNRVIEKLFQKVYARNAVADEHNAFLRFRIGPALCKRNGARKDNIILCGRALERHKVEP